MNDFSRNAKKLRRMNALSWKVNELRRKNYVVMDTEDN